MKRLMDADAIEKVLEEKHFKRVLDSDRWLIADIKKSIMDLPAVDAVPKEKILLFLNIANEELSKAHANKSVNGIMTWSASVTTLEGLLKEYDTADTDIVPVIRCKDCYFCGTFQRKNYCTKYEHSVKQDGFCAWAKPKESE